MGPVWSSQVWDRQFSPPRFACRRQVSVKSGRRFDPDGRGTVPGSRPARTPTPAPGLESSGRSPSRSRGSCAGRSSAGSAPRLYRICTPRQAQGSPPHRGTPPRKQAAGTSGGPGALARASAGWVFQVVGDKAAPRLAAEQERRPIDYGFGDPLRPEQIRACRPLSRAASTNPELGARNDGSIDGAVRDGRETGVNRVISGRPE